MESNEQTNMLHYILVLFGFLILLFVVDVILVSGIIFMEGVEGIILIQAFVFLAAASFGIGFFFSRKMNTIAKSSKSFIWGHVIASFPSAIFVSIWLSLQRLLVEDFNALLQDPSSADPTEIGLLGVIPDPPNALLTSFVIILCFNLFTLYMWFKEKGPLKDLLPYVYFLIVFLLLYFTVPPIVFNIYG